MIRRLLMQQQIAMHVKRGQQERAEPRRRRRDTFRGSLTDLDLAQVVKELTRWKLG